MVFALGTIATDKGPAAAMLIGARVVDIAEVTGRPQDRDMRSLLNDWTGSLARLDEIAAVSSGLGQPLQTAKLLAPILNPGAIFCAGANYADHASEMAAQAGRGAPTDARTLGLRSWHFMKSMHCVTGPGSTVSLHPRSNKVDWEAELAVIIGRKAFNIGENDALAYVAGYAIANDLSARDLGKRAPLPDGSGFKFDWLSHKNWDGSCPLGPWITLARDVSDPQDLAISLDVNGEAKQASNTSRMIFRIDEQIADLSRNFTLWPGDIILTGTPAGVGAGRGEFLKSGDVVRVQIDGLGELINTMR